MFCGWNFENNWKTCSHFYTPPPTNDSRIDLVVLSLYVTITYISHLHTFLSDLEKNILAFIVSDLNIDIQKLNGNTLKTDLPYSISCFFAWVSDHFVVSMAVPFKQLLKRLDLKYICFIVIVLVESWPAHWCSLQYLWQKSINISKVHDTRWPEHNAGLVQNYCFYLILYKKLQ